MPHRRRSEGVYSSSSHEDLAPAPPLPFRSYILSRTAYDASSLQLYPVRLYSCCSCVSDTRVSYRIISYTRDKTVLLGRQKQATRISSHAATHPVSFYCDRTRASWR